MIIIYGAGLENIKENIHYVNHIPLYERKASDDRFCLIFIPGSY